MKRCYNIIKKGFFKMTISIKSLREGYNRIMREKNNPIYYTLMKQDIVFLILAQAILAEKNKRNGLKYQTI